MSVFFLVVIGMMRDRQRSLLAGGLDQSIGGHGLGAFDG